MKQKHKDDHDQLRVMIDDYLVMLSAERPPEIGEVMRRRLAFSTAYLGHVASEAPAWSQLRTGDPGHPTDRLLDEHGCRLREIMPGYSALIQEWTPPRIMAEWPAYCRQVCAQIQRYYVFLAWEEAQILPLLDQLPAPLAAPLPSVLSASCPSTSTG